MTNRLREPKSAVAAVLGGAVTRERLKEAAVRSGKGASQLVSSLMAQSLPGVNDLARAYGAESSLLRLDASFLEVSPKAERLIDPALLRRERCVPVEILEDVCILAVDPARAGAAVAAVRAALHRDVLPVTAEADAIDRVLGALNPPPKALRQGPLPKKDSPVHARFRELVIEDGELDALPVPPEIAS